MSAVKLKTCHSERSEESQITKTILLREILRRFAAQNDMQEDTRFALRFLMQTLFLFGLSTKQGEIFAVAFLLQVLGWNKAQRSGVHAITQTGRSGTVVEDMSQMRIGELGSDFGARQNKFEVRMVDDVIRLQRLGEAGPAGA